MTTIANNAIEIVTFERRQGGVMVGYRQNNRVVYALVPLDLDDMSAKQVGYEQVRKALAYEQTLEIPSFDGSDMETIEVFIPSEPVVNKIKIHGDTVVYFLDESPSKTVEFVASAYDQYDEPLETEFDWTGAENGLLIVDNANGVYEVIATASGVTASITVNVRAYIAPSLPQPEVDYEKLALFEAVEGLESRLIQVEGGRE